MVAWQCINMPVVYLALFWLSLICEITWLNLFEFFFALLVAKFVSNVQFNFLNSLKSLIHYASFVSYAIKQMVISCYEICGFIFKNQEDAKDITLNLQGLSLTKKFIITQFITLTPGTMSVILKQDQLRVTVLNDKLASDLKEPEFLELVKF